MASNIDDIPSLVIRVQFIYCFITSYCDSCITTKPSVAKFNLLIFLSFFEVLFSSEIWISQLAYRNF